MKAEGIIVGQNNVINGATGHVYEYNGEIISYATYGNSGAFATASMPVPQQPLPSYAEGTITSVDQGNQIVYGTIDINGTSIQVGLYG